MVGSVCVECSLSSDCLCSYRFCKHSQSVRYNRDKRPFNRMPIYLGEDVINTILREAIHKDIRSIKGYSRILGGNPSAVMTSAYEPQEIRAGKIIGDCFYFRKVKQSEVRANYERLTWRAESNDISYHYKHWIKKINASPWVYREYEEKRKRIKRIQGFWRKYKHKKMIQKIRNKEWDPIQQYRKDLFCEHLFVKKWDYDSPTIDSEFNIDSCYDRRIAFKTEVNDFDVNAYKRYRRLYHNIEQKNNRYKTQEQVYYLHQIARLVKPNQFHTEDPQSKEYHWIGTEDSHKFCYHTQTHKKKSSIDFYQYIWKVVRYGEVNNWDVYTASFSRKWAKYLKFD